MSLNWDLYLLNRTFIEEGLYSGLLTGHFIHLSEYHFFVNLAGLSLVLLINRSAVLSMKGMASVFFLCIWTGTGIMLFNPEIQRYGGLSGVLHGLFLLSVVSSNGYLLSRKILLIFGVIFKIIAEQTGFYYTEPLSSNIGARVAIDAHLYGFIGGGVIFVLHKIFGECLNFHQKKRPG